MENASGETKVTLGECVRNNELKQGGSKEEILH
jgi:hypothetical protein